MVPPALVKVLPSTAAVPFWVSSHGWQLLVRALPFKVQPSTQQVAHDARLHLLHTVLASKFRHVQQVHATALQMLHLSLSQSSAFKSPKTLPMQTQEPLRLTLQASTMVCQHTLRTGILQLLFKILFQLIVPHYVDILHRCAAPAALSERGPSIHRDKFQPDPAAPCSSERNIVSVIRLIQRCTRVDGIIDVQTQ